MNVPQLTTVDMETIRSAVRAHDRFVEYVDTTSSMIFRACARNAIAGLLLGENGRKFLSDLRRFTDAPMTRGLWALGESHEHPVGTIRYEVRTGLVSERCVHSSHRTLHECLDSLTKLHRENSETQAWVVLRGTREDLLSIGMRESHYDTLIVRVDGSDLTCEVRS
jgi:hypothetical protein